MSMDSEGASINFPDSPLSEYEEEAGVYVNEPYDYGQGQVYYDSELLTQGGGYLDSNTSHFTRLGLPQPSSTTNPNSVIQIDCTSESSNSVSTKVSISNSNPSAKYHYSVKVIDPAKKSSFEVKELQNRDKLVSFHEIKQSLMKALGLEIGKIGYMRPGHGIKGKKCLLEDDDDVAEMYSAVYNDKRHIVLWCYPATTGTVSKEQKGGKKRKHEDEGDSGSRSKQTATQKKIDAIEEIIAKLKEIHGGSYKVEHLNAWAHLIQVGKHTSYDSPPNYPYFTGRKKSQMSSEGAMSSKYAEGSSANCPEKTNSSVLSPGKRVQLRSQCIDQLSRWHSLKQEGGISAEEYEQLRKNILSDIGKF